MIEHIWLNEPVHSAIEAAGSLVAIILGSLLLVQRRSENFQPLYVWIAAALFAMGILDGFHSVIHVSASFFWTRGFATFFGGILFTFVWLPDRWARSEFARGFPWAVIAFSTALGLYLALVPTSLPRLFENNGTFFWGAKFINVIGGLGYLIAIPKLIGRNETRMAKENFIFALQCLMLGIAGLLFAASQMWGLIWWVFHFLRFISYLVVLRYVFFSYVEIQRQISFSNDQLQKRNVELAASNQELETFCYSVSHDLRAPLRGIDGFSQALIEDYGTALAQEGQKYLEFIREGVQQMGRLIDDLLKLSRLTRADITLIDVDLSGLASQILARFQRAEPNRRVKINITPGLIATADYGLMAIALENLLNNAWKFTGLTAEARITFGQEVQDSRIVFFVEDNGAGFDMAFLNKLFGAFQRLHTHAEFPGSGIGLATVMRIIHRHGGRVWAESRVGHGAKFYFTLP